jgi:hypothetical protein
VTGGDELGLGFGRAVLEQADDDVLVQERTRLGGSAACEIGDDLADLVGDRRVQPSSREVVLRRGHAYSVSRSSVRRPPLGRERERTPTKASVPRQLSGFG